jgi:hypothetical protein
MDSAKSAIKSLVLDLRKTLESEIEVQLRRYGISAGKWRDVSELKHLDDHGVACRIRIEEAIRHEMHHGGDKTDEAARAAAVHWFIREIAFTHLNRLVALKALEVRGLIPEIIQTRPEYGDRSRAHRDYRQTHAGRRGDAIGPDDALQAAIKSVCRTVYAEFRILFDVSDPQRKMGLTCVNLRPRWLGALYRGQRPRPRGRPGTDAERVGAGQQSPRKVLAVRRVQLRDKAGTLARPRPGGPGHRAACRASGVTIDAGDL